MSTGDAAPSDPQRPRFSPRRAARPRRQPPPPWAWWLAAGLMLALGARLYLLADHSLDRYSTAAKAVLFLPLLALLPPVARGVAGLAGRLRRLPRRGRKWVALGVAAAGMFYLYASAVAQGYRLVPMVKDEYSYLLQAQMLANGRLWMPRHPLADFFETTLVITDRVYASVFPPGTAMLYAPGVAVGWPHWVTALLISGATLAVLYLVVAALSDDWLGILACLLLLACTWFQALWHAAMSQVPLMLAGLLTVWCFLQWRSKGHPLRWAFAAGAAAGFAMIVRPQDALSYALPVAAAFVLEWRRRPRAAARSLLVASTGAAPLLLLQLVTNVGVTGRWSEFPYRYYHRRDLPGLGYGFGKRDFYSGERPQSVSPQKQAEFEAERSVLRRTRASGLLWHLWYRRLPAIIDGALPEPSLVVLLPVGVLLVSRRSRWVLAATVPLWVLAYLPWPFMLPHYAVVLAPGAMALVVLGAAALERRAGRARATVTALFALGALGVGLAGLPELNPVKKFGSYPVVTPRDIDEAVRRVTSGRAVVLLRFDENEGYKMRPYNLDVAWPDDAHVVKALDLGPRNREIVSYYAERQPDRVFFLYDFADGSLERLDELPAAETSN